MLIEFGLHDGIMGFLNKLMCHTMFSWLAKKIEATIILYWMVEHYFCKTFVATRNPKKDSFMCGRTPRFQTIQPNPFDHGFWWSLLWLLFFQAWVLLSIFSVIGIILDSIRLHDYGQQINWMNKKYFHGWCS